jgi:hypothetical protein
VDLGALLLSLIAAKKACLDTVARVLGFGRIGDSLRERREILEARSLDNVRPMVKMVVTVRVEPVRGEGVWFPVGIGGRATDEEVAARSLNLL